MISTFICLHCGGTFLCNPRVKNQKYCSDKECRRARYPACDYQKQYRKKHPEYVNRCRELQKKRYKKRREADRKAIDKKIVNRNTLFSNLRGDKVCELIPVGIRNNNVNHFNNQNFVYLHIKMPNKPEIKLNHGYHRDLEVVLIRFCYNIVLKKYLKSGNDKIYLKSILRNFLKEFNGVNTYVSRKNIMNLRNPLDNLRI